MEKISSILENNELANEAKFKEIKITLEKALYEGFYDETYTYTVTFRKGEIEKSLAKIFGADKAEII